MYDGSKPFWKETDPCEPLNMYGKTKLEAEQAIMVRTPPHRTTYPRRPVPYYTETHHQLPLDASLALPRDASS